MDRDIVLFANSKHGATTLKVDALGSLTPGPRVFALCGQRFQKYNVLRGVWDGPRPDLWPCLWCTRICVCSASMVLFRAGTQGHVTLLPPKRVVLSTCKRVSLFKRAAGRLVRVTGISHASVSKTLPRREGNRARDAVPSP